MLDKGIISLCRFVAEVKHYFSFKKNPRFLCPCHGLADIMAKTINDEFMQQVATEQAWKKLAKEYAWTEDLLEKYSDKLNWKLISKNKAIRWTIPMLKKFSRMLDWKELSELSPFESHNWFTEAHIETFKDKWDWSILVTNYQWSEKLIDKYIDLSEKLHKMNFDRNDTSDDNFLLDITDLNSFYNKYKEYIPVSSFQQSVLMDRIVEQRLKQLLAEILS